MADFTYGSASLEASDQSDPTFTLGGLSALQQIESNYDPSSAFAWLSDPAAVPIITYFGQSLSNWHISDGASSPQPIYTPTPVYPGYVLAPITQAGGVPKRVPAGADIVGFTNLYEFNAVENNEIHAETGLSGHLNTFVKMLHDALGRWVQVVGFSGGVSNLVYAQLKSGSDPFENYLANMSQCVNLLRAQGKRPIIPYVVWKQGNSDTNSPNSAEKYARDMDQLQRDLQTKFRALTGQVEPVMLLIGQDNAAFFNTLPPTSLALAFDDLDIPPFGQMKAARRNPNILIMGPDYDCPTDPPYHNPHMNSRGYLLAGTREGRIAANAVLGVSWAGLKWIEENSEWLSTYTLQLQYDVPIVRANGSNTPDFAFGTAVDDTSSTIVSASGLFDSSNTGCGYSMIDRQGNRVETNDINYVEVYYPGGNVQKENVRIHFARPQLTSGFITCATKETAGFGILGNFVHVVTPGSGGTDGTYNLIFNVTSGSFVNTPVGTFTVSGGAVVSATTSDPGFALPPTAPTVTVDTSNCPGLTGASITATAAVISCSGPLYGPRSLLRAGDTSLVTAAGDVASYDWALMQYQAIAPAPTQRPNILRNARGRISQRGSSIVCSDGTKVQDGWYVLTNGQTPTATTFIDPKVGSMLRLTSAVGTTKAAFVQPVPFDKTFLLRGQPISFNARIRRSNPSSAIRTRIILLFWSGTQDAPLADIVNNWNSTDLATPGAFFVNDPSLTIAATTALADSQNIIIDTPNYWQTVPANANNIYAVILTNVVMAVGETMDVLPWLEHGITQTGVQSIDDATEFDNVRRFYGTMQVRTISGQSQWVQFPRRVYSVPSVSGSGLSVISNITQDGFEIAGGATENVTVTWDTGL